MSRQCAHSGCRRTPTLESELCQEHNVVSCGDLRDAATIAVASVKLGAFLAGALLDGLRDDKAQRRPKRRATTPKAAAKKPPPPRKSQEKHSRNKRGDEKQPRNASGIGTAGECREILGFGDNVALTPEAIAQRRRELAALFHPDVGGSQSQMSRVNAAADQLLTTHRGKKPLS